VAQWFYHLDSIDIHANEDFSFTVTCENDHLLVAQWVYGLGGVNIHASHDHAFKWPCNSGHLLIAQWLYSLDGFNNLQINANVLFQMTCNYGHSSVCSMVVLFRWNKYSWKR
jgi:hypothetical protein